ncbi:MAG: hypothetical protein CVU38_19100, partial [Chloroflexi bacterium HGW-Chloroflexi-1]
MKLAAFDLEIAKQAPADAGDLRRFAPLGITCAAVAPGATAELTVWQGFPQLTRLECQGMVRELQALVQSGYTLVTWNGCAFDFWVLAQESGMLKECGELALNHVDLMLMVTFTKGYYLGLDRALQGAGLKGKVKAVTLKDGTRISDMSGLRAPELWAAGELEAVLEYLRGDASQLLELAELAQRKKALTWRSNRGMPQSISVKRLLPVTACFDIPEPDVSWMDNPPTRQQFVDWIPGWEKLTLISETKRT